MNPNTPLASPRWVFGQLREELPGFLPSVFKLTVGPDLVATKARFAAANACQQRLLASMTEQQADLVFLTESIPGTDILEAKQFSIPWTGVPTIRTEDSTAEAWVFTLAGYVALFRLDRQRPKGKFLSEILTAASQAGRALDVVREINSLDVVHLAFSTLRVRTVRPLVPDPDFNLEGAAALDTDEARGLMDFLCARTCSPADHGSTCELGVSHHNGCIPFNYPEVGCAERSHFSCLLLAQQLGERASAIHQVIATGSAQDFCTQNSPCRHVGWSEHVAPAVKVGGELLVLDPSLFSKPVSTNVWRKRFNADYLGAKHFVVPEDDSFENLLTEARLALLPFKSLLTQRLCDCDCDWPPYGAPCP